MTLTAVAVLAGLRGLIELALWLLIGRSILAVLAGKSGAENAVVRMFNFLLKPIRACASVCFPGLKPLGRDVLSGVVLLGFWLSLGLAKLILMKN